MKQNTRSAIIPAFLINLLVFLWAVDVNVFGFGVPIYIFFVFLYFPFLNVGAALESFFKMCIVLLLVVFFQWIFAPAEFNIAKSIAVSIVLSFVVSNFLYYLNACALDNYTSFLRISKYFLFALLFLQILQLVFNFTDNKYDHYIFNFSRPSGFFHEPSHLAMSLSFFVFMFIVHYSYFISRLGKNSAFVLGLIIILCPSTTMVAVLVLAIAWVALLRGKASLRKIVIVASSLIVIVLTYQNPEIYDRIDTVISIFMRQDYIGSENLSALIFYKGYEMASYGIVNYPFGVGLLNFSYLNMYSSLAHLGEVFFTLNKDDGSSILFKGIGEFGLFFVAFIIIFIFKILKKRNSYQAYSRYVIEQLFLMSFLFGFIRSASYFDGPLLIGLSIVSGYMLGVRPVNFAAKTA